jgi:hypothetical protein
MTQAKPTAPSASPEFTAPVGAFPIAGGAPEVIHTDAKLQPEDATITRSLCTVSIAKV